jgi:hypothetical protein
MKPWIILASATLALASQWAAPEAAHARVERGYRYSVTYEQWDRGFSNYYGYTERNCSTTYSYGWRSSTCYETTYFQPATMVYVEEVQIDGYHRVNVYRDSGYRNVYTSYYVYNDYGTRYVTRRDFHSGYMGRTYYSSHWHTHSSVYAELDLNRAFDKVVTGGAMVLYGGLVMASSNGSPEVAALGAASVASGALSISLGLQQAHEESELAKAIRANAQSGSRASDVY